MLFRSDQYSVVPFDVRTWPLEPTLPLAETAFKVAVPVTLSDDRFAPTSNVVEPLEEITFASVRLTANSPAAIYAVFDGSEVFGNNPDVDVLRC